MARSTEVPNTDLVLLALALAGGDAGFVDVEDIAQEAFSLSHQRFGWRTRPYPSDKTVVQAIADLEQKHPKDELTRRGVRDQADKIATRRLTTAGREAARAVAERVAGREFSDLAEAIAHFRTPGQAAPEPTPAQRRRAQGELLELHKHPAFESWADSGDLTGVERWQLYDALNCLPDAPPEAVDVQLDHMRGLAEQWQDDDAAQFLAALSAAMAAPAAGN